MKNLYVFWRKLTPTKAVEQASGKLEILFFESVYRITYLVGISTSDHTSLYAVYSNTIKLLMLLFVAGELWFVITVEWTIDSIIDGVNIVIIQICSIYKYRNMVMVIHDEVFKQLASSMETVNLDLTTDERKRKLFIWIVRNDSSFKLLFGIGTCTIIAWYVHPFIDDVEYNLHVAVYLPFNYATSTRYVFTYICVAIVFAYISYFVMVNDLIVQAHLMNLLCQFNVLEDCFRNILKDCNADYTDTHFSTLLSRKEFQMKYISRLGTLVDQHKIVLKNTHILRDVLSTPMLAHLISSTTLLGSIGYQVAITIDENFTKGLMSFLFLGYNMFVLYIICRWCEEVKFQSESIMDAVYCSGWESGITTVPGVRYRLLLILARTHKPAVLSAGGMYDLSLASFATMVRTSYSALTLLLRLRHN